MSRKAGSPPSGIPSIPVDFILLSYADVQRKIKETKYTIALSTVQRNRIALYKAVMTSEELERVRGILKERCPQHRTRG